MRKLNAGDLSRKLGRIRYSPRSSRWKRKARAQLLKDQGIAEADMMKTEDGGHVCSKRRFSSRPDAELELYHLAHTPQKRRREKRVYSCKWCKAWHLTSTPLTYKE